MVVSRLKRPYGRTFIRNWRAHRNLTLAQLAQRIGTTHATLSRIERGLQPYNQPLLEALAEARGVAPHIQFLGEHANVSQLFAAADFGPADGRPVLHFHPNLCFRWVRVALADALTERGYRSIGYDRAGCGLSDPAPSLHPFEAAARDAASVLDALKIDRVRLFAAHAGAGAAIAFAVRYPDRVSSAVMLMPRAPSAEPVFHSATNSQFASSFESSSEIGYGCASSFPAKTMQGVCTLETKARSTQ